MELNCELLGISKEEMTERVISSMAEKLLRNGYDETEDESYGFRTTQLVKDVEKNIQNTVDAKLKELNDSVLVPLFNKAIDQICLQQTNEWGEKLGEPKTFTEFIVANAKAYLHEEVNSNGKTRKEYGSSYFTASTTRLTILVNKSMQEQYSRIAGDVNKSAREVLTEGLGEAMRIQLEKAAKEFRLKIVRS